MGKTVIYRTPVPDSVSCSLFGGDPSAGRPAVDPRGRSEGEYRVSEERFDSTGRPTSLRRYAEDGTLQYRREVTYDGGGRLLREREEFPDVGTVVTREHRFEGGTETIRVLFGGELEEVIVRTFDESGAAVSEESTDASGEPRSLTEWDAAGRVTHAESPGMAQELTYDEAGNLVELVVQRDDGSETIERSTVADGRIARTEILEDGEPVGSRLYEYEPRKVRMVESRRGVVAVRREETFDDNGRPARTEETSESPSDGLAKSVSTSTWEADGRRRSVEYSRQRTTPMGARAASGFRQYVYDARGRIAGILVCGPSDEADLEADSYYRFEYED